MKTLRCLVAFSVAIIAWAVAVVDFILAKISTFPRPYLVPARTFFAAYRTCQAYLMGRPTHLETYRVREYPRYKYF